ncbi:Retrovirus-related Pol polyprotein from transposon 17.6, partial [Mucuna pruriens]
MVETRRRKAKGGPRGNKEAICDQFHLGDTVSHIAGKCGDGQESQWEIAHVHRLYRLEQGMPKGPISLTQHRSYNQIKMHPRDEAKTAFITDVRAYFYKVMPFGLKNIGATYQRLVDKIFEGLIGGDVEVYVDDMVVKSSTAADHYRALGRVFQMLRRHQLKLNPEKCSFERGIKANPKKCQAIINMRSLRTVKEVQQLTGRITTLSRFLSRLAETIVPIFNTLKKGDSFVWMVESEGAFLRLKALLATPQY